MSSNAHRLGSHPPTPTNTTSRCHTLFRTAIDLFTAQMSGPPRVPLPEPETMRTFAKSHARAYGLSGVGFLIIAGAAFAMNRNKPKAGPPS